MTSIRPYKHFDHQIFDLSMIGMLIRDFHMATTSPMGGYAQTLAGFAFHRAR